MYRLVIFILGRFFILREYILGIMGGNVPAETFLSQPVHFGHFGRKCTGW